MREQPYGSTVLRTSDVAEAEHVVSAVYVPHRLRARRSLDVRLDLVESARLTFGYLTYGGEAVLDVPPMGSCYHVNITLGGCTEVRHGGTSVTTAAGRSGAVLSPGLPSTLFWSGDAAQFAVKIPVSAMVEQTSALLHDAVDVAPVFDPHVDLTGAGAGILPAARFLARQLGGGAPLDDLVRRETESYLLTQLLLGTGHSYSGRLADHVGPAGRLAFEEAVDYVESYPERVLGTAELADVVGTTATALAAAFENELGLTVEEFVRGVRLTRVHAEVRGARDRAVEVASLAARWGFRGAADLRAAYRVQYGADLDGAPAVNPG
ncbi:helix-turn-helix domain-containing protein [Pseudonocardia broussonetiae]|uniref:Helix-turn-helix domain-containing protein n=1 Tax=Pseudonocardia broussonetiae TaxID=2736640 RepID=A0A6M6JNU8_9PSEU|nr:helix-turn-helix domain-containing protein [Pseudonocardia broussonetiae]QJY48966.1 helix-turn-helix domain-containing protein [Pseudonocardia broussonetiae]